MKFRGVGGMKAGSENPLWKGAALEGERERRGQKSFREGRTSRDGNGARAGLPGRGRGCLTKDLPALVETPC